MLIKIKTCDECHPRYIKDEIISAASAKVYRYKFLSAEIALDNYLKKKFNIGLRQACLQIIQKAKMYSGEKKLIYSIVIPEGKYNWLATLITYGNSEVKGSSILVSSFSKVYEGI